LEVLINNQAVAIQVVDIRGLTLEMRLEVLNIIIPVVDTIIHQSKKHNNKWYQLIVEIMVIKVIIQKDLHTIVIDLEVEMGTKVKRK
jgi:hypothetical protein